MVGTAAAAEALPKPKLVVVVPGPVFGIGLTLRLLIRSMRSLLDESIIGSLFAEDDEEADEAPNSKFVPPAALRFSRRSMRSLFEDAEEDEDEVSAPFRC